MEESVMDNHISISIRDLCKEIILSAVEPMKLDLGLVKRLNYARYATAVILVDDVETIEKKRRLILNKVAEFDFWNEWEGFFLLHYKSGNVIDARSSKWEIPKDTEKEIKETWDPEFAGPWYGICVGDLILTKEGELYSVNGFDRTWLNERSSWMGYSEHYFFDPFYPIKHS